MVAAALVGGADVVVTEDVRLSGEVDRLASGPHPLYLEAQRADTFTGLAIDVDLTTAVGALVDMARRRWLGADRPDITDGEVLERLISWCSRRSWTTTAHQLGRPEVRLDLRPVTDRSNTGS